MKPWVGSLLVLCLACSKGGSEKSAPPAAAEQAATAQPPPSTPPASDNSEAKAIKSLQSDPAGKVKAYVVFQQRWLDVLKKFGVRGEEYKAKQKSGQFAGVTGMGRDLVELHSMGKDVKDALDKAKAESGLSEQELSALGELMANAQMQEQMQKGIAEMNAANPAAQFAKMEQAIATAPVEMREDLKKQLDDMKQAQVAVQEAASLKDMRAKYGDPVVEAMLSAVPALNAQLKQFQATSK